jgi:hypothetical protein
MFVKPVIAHFMIDPYQDKETAGHSYGNPGNIDERIALVSGDVPQSDFQIIVKHGDSKKGVLFGKAEN